MGGDVESIRSKGCRVPKPTTPPASALPPPTSTSACVHMASAAVVGTEMATLGLAAWEKTALEKEKEGLEQLENMLAEELELQQLMEEQEKLELEEYELELFETEDEQLQRALRESLKDCSEEETSKIESVTNSPAGGAAPEAVPLQPEPPTEVRRKRLRPMEDWEPSPPEEPKKTVEKKKGDEIPELSPTSKKRYQSYWARFVATPQNHGQRSMPHPPAKEKVASNLILYTSIFFFACILQVLSKNNLGDACFPKINFPDIKVSQCFPRRPCSQGMDELDTMPMFGGDPTSEPEALETFPPVPLPHPLETTEDTEESKGIKHKPLEPRPAVLESLTPVTPSEQRKLLPKSKAKAKAKPADGAEPAKKRARKSISGESEPKTGDKKKRGRPPSSKPSVSKGKAKGKVETSSKRPKKTDVASGSAADGATVAGASSSAIETKKRVSRKSSAYHSAKRAAMKSGKSLEEAKAIGQKVARLF